MSNYVRHSQCTQNQRRASALARLQQWLIINRWRRSSLVPIRSSLPSSSLLSASSGRPLTSRRKFSNAKFLNASAGFCYDSFINKQVIDGGNRLRYHAWRKLSLARPVAATLPATENSRYTEQTLPVRINSHSDTSKYRERYYYFLCFPRWCTAGLRGCWRSSNLLAS